MKLVIVTKKYVYNSFITKKVHFGETFRSALFYKNFHCIKVLNVYIYNTLCYTKYKRGSVLFVLKMPLFYVKRG